MKQKIVIKMSIHDDKYRSKALKIAVCIPGVESAAVIGEGMDEVEVVGDDIDSVELIRQLRKKMGHAELLSVGEAEDGQFGQDSPSSETAESPVVGMVAPSYYGYPLYYHYEVREQTWDNRCTIL